MDWRAFDRFLQSPYFNTRADVRVLFHTIRSFLETRRALPDRNSVFRLSFPERQLPDQEMHLLMTYLVKLVEQFLQQEQLQMSPATEDWLRVTAFNRLGLKKESDRAVNKAFLRLENAPLRSAAYHEQRHRLVYEQVRQHREQPEENARHLKQLNQLLNTSLVVLWLRQACLLLSEKAVYNMEPDTRFLPEVFRWVESDNHIDIPGVSAYYFGCKMLLSGEEIWFQSLKNILSVQGQAFPPEELYDPDGHQLLCAAVECR